MLSYRDANLLLGLLWHSPNAQRERKVPNTTACRVHFSCDCICILTTTTYYHHLSSTFVRVQNDVKHSDSQLNSVASMLRVKPTRSILRFHRVGQAPYFYLCDEQLLVLDFSLFTGESYLSSSQLITSFCTGSIIFHLFCFQHHRIEQYFYIESSSSILPKKIQKKTVYGGTCGFHLTSQVRWNVMLWLVPLPTLSDRGPQLAPPLADAHLPASAHLTPGAGREVLLEVNRCFVHEEL